MHEQLSYLKIKRNEEEAMENIKERSYDIAVFGVFIMLWEVLRRVCEVPEYILAGPKSVFFAFVSDYDILFEHGIYTFAEIISGFLLGVFSGIVLSFGFVYTRIGHRIIYPIVSNIQSLPKIVFIPTLMLLIGRGFFSKIIIAAMFCVFPILVSLSKGLGDISPDSVDELRTYGASKFEELRFVRIPAALPHFFIGLDLSLVLSFTGVIAAEYFMGERGLGYLVSQGQSTFRLDMMSASVLCLIGYSMFLRKILKKVEKEIVFWKKPSSPIGFED